MSYNPYDDPSRSNKIGEFNYNGGVEERVDTGAGIKHQRKGSNNDHVLHAHVGQMEGKPHLDLTNGQGSTIGKIENDECEFTTTARVGPDTVFETPMVENATTAYIGIESPLSPNNVDTYIQDNKLHVDADAPAKIRIFQLNKSHHDLLN